MDKMVVYHLPQIPGNSDVNGKQFFDSFHWKIPGTNGNSEKVVRTFRMEIHLPLTSFLSFIPVSCCN